LEILQEPYKNLTTSRERGTDSFPAEAIT
jgi:hypothetical protein